MADEYEITLTDRDGDAVVVSRVHIGGEAHIQLAGDEILQFSMERALLFASVITQLVEGR